MEDSASGYQNPNRGQNKYLKNNRSRGHFNQFRRSRDTESPREALTDDIPCDVEQNQTFAAERLRDSNSFQNHVPKFQPRNPGGQFRNRNRYNSAKYSNDRNSSIKSADHDGNNTYDNSQYDSAPDANSSIQSQRGKIIGGRYIRRHANNVSAHFTSSEHFNPHGDPTVSEPFVEKKFNSRSTKQKDSYVPQNFRNSSYDRNDSAYFRSQGYGSRGDFQEQNFTNHEDSGVSRGQSENPQNSYLNSNEDYSKKKHTFVKNYNKKFGRASENSDESGGSNVQRKYNGQRPHDNNQNYFPTNEASYESRNFYKQEKFHPETSTRFQKSLKISSEKKTMPINATQRELLMERLNKGECECLVCCEYIRVKDQIWHCLNCFHVFHLRCIRKWARSPAAVVEDGGWRCPACQSMSTKVPYDYLCFCGKRKNPEVDYHLTPHSCGEICARKGAECDHLCKELCHPGPCPPCRVTVQKACPCGKLSKKSPCSQSANLTCQNTCEKILNCGVHRCTSLCHSGTCDECEANVSQKCFCGKSEQTVQCTIDTALCLEYSCGAICEKLLDCSLHRCDAVCHPGGCRSCRLSTEIVQTCNCGKASIADLVAAGKCTERRSCTDPIPCCEEICGKVLFCGPKEDPHACRSPCHEGPCPPCELSSSYKCRCGAFTRPFPCAEVGANFQFLCERRCNRRKDCGRHKCLATCCVGAEHRCELVCNRRLSCGLHQCQETCHSGNCPTCYNVSFEELRCHCGASVLYPPVHCGTKPPECSEPCTRRHPCEHEVKHTCHSEDTCPPCTSLVAKWCFGRHKQCGSVMCFLDGISCGMACNKPLPCGFHKCQLTCHANPCLAEGAKCSQLCTLPRANCGHPCGNPCHEGPCPDTPCKTQVQLNCPCGHRSENTTCHDSTRSYKLMSVSVLASKMQEIKDGQSVNLNDVLGRKTKNSKLQCSEECAVIERNKRLALALQIQNPDLSCSPGPPNYSEFLKDETKKSPIFVADVYDKISDLVQLAKQSKQKCRSHSFPPMNRDQRRVVHELAEFFGCETQSYDEEPKKNVVVTAFKNKCWLPFVSVMTIVQRDMGMRKGPAPLVSQRDSKVPSAAAQKKKIDYFDYNE